MAGRSSVIPSPRLQQVRNATRFPHFQFDKMGKGRRFYDVVILCASHVLAAGRLMAAASHRGPVFADEPWDPAAAELSSLRRATDVLLRKPGTDVYITGAASALHWTARSDWWVELQVSRQGAVLLHKALHLTGPRVWHWHPDPEQRTLSEPVPTHEVPLRYELAYGGWWFDQGDDPEAAPRIHAANPSGTGCFGTALREHHPKARQAAGHVFQGPQIEVVDTPVLRANQKDTPVAGLGPIARHWQPRAGLAGTYDEAWQRRNAQEPFMDYAEDFDERFFQYAPADQVVPHHLVGDECLRLSGFFASTESIEMQLPLVGIQALCRRGDGSEYAEQMKLDTVHLDLDEMLVHLTWRLTLDQTADTVAVDLAEQPLDEIAPAAGARP
ncbi:hypothetical protein M2165_000286 [Variovorax sp. TBS-050B]|uniref:DUF2169 family type VI secretion system accessory protein n=1 Tax=Variovorax sp. TBS-050B TaxID=2940551 RepID=UPI002473FE77|nr:DUF2169 domain-containing protein [Variovorax sp. TBS-050B]MDH6590397.1 hypothetical protein [Variovorax sp. TBS-050B]